MPTAASSAVNNSHDARLAIRISRTQKSVLQRAAALSGRTLSDFVVASAQAAANRIIQDHDLIRLSRTEQTAFVKNLLRPPAPRATLRKAAAEYKKRLGR